LATLDACLPSAVRVDFGRCAMVRFLFAVAAAFLMFFLAACFCLAVAITVLLDSYFDQGESWMQKELQNAAKMMRD
jgi:hypothetical protein